MRAALPAASLVATLLVAASCSVDDTANPGVRCDDAGACPDGMNCYRGFCIRGAGGACTEEGMVESCYTGMPPETVGVGVCRPGERLCMDGFLLSCLGQLTPGPETCNGRDDDCDGLTDELADTECDTGQPGICASGRLACRTDTAVCEATVDPVREECNGEDDDCDGTIDDNIVIACYGGAAGCVDSGDGTFDCMGLCAPGSLACEGGELGACVGAVEPIASGMDDCTDAGMTAADDDCDGMIDEDCLCTPTDTQACYGGPAGTAGEGQCVMGMQTCDATGQFGACEGEVRPLSETCNGLDDDCDGAVDDVVGAGDPCTVEGQEGACRNGTRGCMDDALACIAPTPMMEVCDGLDNDCDGAVDNGFDLSTDEVNCGTCGRACGEGLTCCGGACVELESSQTHCGECGAGCGDQECCDGACADTTGDEANCGTCGNVCGDGRTCCGGTCADTRVNIENCGMCGNACTAGESCCGGTCADPASMTCMACTEDCASMGMTCCAGSCVDMSSDPASCGTCGNACASDELCCGGTCTPNDASNCGACGTACGADQLCCASACIPVSDANCTACGEPCPAGQSCCGGACFDLARDENNCGTCGEVCPMGDMCTNGICCGPGLTGCGGVCVNTQTDSDHCGRCDRGCFLLRCSGGGCI